MRARALALLLTQLLALVDGAGGGHRRRSDPPALPLALVPDQQQYWRCAASANRSGCAIEGPYGVLNLSAPIPPAEAHLGLVHRPRPAAVYSAVGSNASSEGEGEEEPRKWWRRQLADEGVTKPLDAAEENTPLFQGIGTHYANIFVGVPPQRVAVIVDTGSHHTAFPCTGCEQCGEHTGPYFNPADSTTQTTLPCGSCEAGAKCEKKRCQLSQSYTEGSSWKAYQVRDEVWVGGISATEPAGATGPGAAGADYAVGFTFGCQFSETGLFRTQKADGIMGMSPSAGTLVPQLQRAGKLRHRAFSLCLRAGGGRLALGGATTAHHTAPMAFAPLARAAGWFAVKLTDVLVGGGSIGVIAAVWNAGKGTIVDSGTTDTYLPKRAADAFRSAWEAIVGREYANARMMLDAAAVGRLPAVSFVFEGGATVDVLPSAYMELGADGAYVPRIYLTEGEGAVLGGNFMRDHDVLFDAENRRLGFAAADCSYVGENRSHGG